MSFSYLPAGTLEFLRRTVDSGFLASSIEPSVWKGCACVHVEFISPISPSSMDLDCYLIDCGLPRNLLESQRKACRVSQIRVRLPFQVPFHFTPGGFYGCKAQLDFENGIPVAHIQHDFEVWPLGEFEDNQTPTIVHHFAGAFGGWSQAQRWLVAHNLIHEPLRTIMIECDYQICLQAQQTIGAPVVFPDDPTVPASNKVIVQCDVADMRWSKQITTGKNMLHTASFPCQPFPRGGKKAGLESQDGQTIIRLALVLRVMQPIAIALENVSEFRSHPHAGIILRFLEWAGFRLVWQQIHDLKSLSSCSRARWLGVFLRKDMDSDLKIGNFQLSDMQVDLWDSVGYQFELPPAMKQQLILTPDLVKLYGDQDLLPKAKHTGSQMTVQQVLKARCPSSEDILGTLVASYMRQHELPLHHLTKSGIFAELMCVKDDKFSFFDPVRWAALLGNLHTLFLPYAMEEAFLILGNSIAVPHAALALIVMLNHTICQKASIPVDQTIKQMWADRTLINQAVITEVENGFAIMTPNDFVMIGPICRYNQIDATENQQMISFIWPDGSLTDIAVFPNQSVASILFMMGVPEYQCKLWGLRSLVDNRVFQANDAIDLQIRQFTWIFLPNEPDSAYQNTQIDTVSDECHEISPTVPWTIQDDQPVHVQWVTKELVLSSGANFGVDVPDTHTVSQIAEIFENPDHASIFKAFVRNNEVCMSTQLKELKEGQIVFKKDDPSEASHIPGQHDQSLVKIDLTLSNGNKIQVEMDSNRTVATMISIVEHTSEDANLCACVDGIKMDNNMVLANMPNGEIKICRSSKRKADCCFTNLEVRTLAGSTRILPTTQTGTIREALIEAAFPPGLIKCLRPTCQGKNVSIDSRIQDLHTSHIVLRAYPLLGGAPKIAEDPLGVNDPWASFKASNATSSNAMGGNTRWDQLLLESDHPWHTKDGHRVKQVSFLQLGPKVGGVAFGTRNNLSMMTNFQPTIPTLILLPGLKDGNSYDPSLKAMMMPPQQVVVKEPNGKQYKRIVIPLALKGEFIFKLSSEPLATASASCFAELVLEVHEALVSSSYVQSINEQPLEFFRKHMSSLPVAMREMSIYSYRKIKSKDGFCIHQVLLKIPEDNRKGLLAFSGVGDIFVRQFLHQDELTDHSLLPKYWPITPQDLKQITQLGKALEKAFAGIALTAKGLAIRSMNTNLAEARAAILQDDVRFTDRNRHVVTRHVFLAQGYPFGVSHEAIIESIFEATKLAAVPLRSFKLAGMTTWIVGFEANPTKHQFVIAFGSETHEILLLKQENQKQTSVKQGKKKGGGKGNDAPNLPKKPLPPAPIVTSTIGTKDVDTEHRLSALESKVNGLEHSHKTLATKVDTRFDDISSQLQKVLHAVTQGHQGTQARGREANGPTGESPPAKAPRGS